MRSVLVGHSITDMDLYDAVMIKDNHISFAGSITKAVQTVKSKLGHTTKVEVETESTRAGA